MFWRLFFFFFAADLLLFFYIVVQSVVVVLCLYMACFSWVWFWQVKCSMMNLLYLNQHLSCLCTCARFHKFCPPPFFPISSPRFTFPHHGAPHRLGEEGTKRITVVWLLCHLRQSTYPATFYQNVKNLHHHYAKTYFHFVKTGNLTN